MTARNNSITVDLKRPTIFAHRGSSAYAPENTLAAFTLAVQQHADAIELDAQLSADGHIVVMHDDTVDRTTDGSGRVKTLNLAELKKLDGGDKFDPRYKGEKIPTLAEIFEEVGQKTFINVELTNYSSPMDDLPEKAAELVKTFHLEKTVLFSSFNMIALIRARRVLPRVAMGLLTFTGLGKITFYSRLIRFGPLFALHPAVSDVSQKLVEAIHRRRSRVHVYTVNDADEMRRLFSEGVDGIFTDDPLLAQKVLSEPTY